MFDQCSNLTGHLGGEEEAVAAVAAVAGEAAAEAAAAAAAAAKGTYILIIFETNQCLYTVCINELSIKNNCLKLSTLST